MMRRLAEVAGKLGMSEATVSRVLNGKPGVSEATTGGSWCGACPPSW
ncbi:helix-turn-helix domain-containing protein [Streptosporangium sp. NPDC003464]